MNLSREYYKKWVEEYRVSNKTDDAHIDDVAYAAFLAGVEFGENASQPSNPVDAEHKCPFYGGEITGVGHRCLKCDR